MDNETKKIADAVIMTTLESEEIQNDIITLFEGQISPELIDLLCDTVVLFQQKHQG